MIRKRVLRTVLVAAAVCAASWPGAAGAASKPRPLFASEDVLHLTLRGPLSNMPRAVGAKPLPGQITVEGSAPETLPVQLSVRGITRRMKEICAFPPLRVVFPQKPGDGSLFKGQKSLKLVTHCQQPAGYQQYVLLEYAAYRVYRALTPQGFNVRLAKIDYQNEDGRLLSSHMGFFIEDINDVARRNQQTRLKGLQKIAISQLNAAAAARFAVFQYMISNLDWAMTANAPGDDCCHNSRLLAATDTATDITPIPYDFDYSGLVNAPYAVPPAGIPLLNVRVRRYRGFCQHNDQAAALAAQMASRRAELLAIVDATPELEDSPRQRADKYLGEFFDEMASPAKVADLMKFCLK